MIKKKCLQGMMALIVGGCFSMSFSAQENLFVELGKINVPKDMELGIKILPQGEYKITLVKQRRAAIMLADPKPDAAGMMHAWSVDAETTDIKENYPQPKVDVSVVMEGGESFVQIQVFLENKVYKSLWKCAGEAIEPSKREKEQGPIDPAIEMELKLLKEVHFILDKFAEKIWPGWDGYKTLDFTLYFPNRDVVFVTQNQRLPKRFKTLPGETMDGKTVYIDRTKELSGRIGPNMSIHGHGDISGVTSFLMSPLKTMETKPELKPYPEQQSLTSQEEYMGLTRMLINVHEAFHSFQAKLMVEAQKAGPIKPKGALRSDFDANLEFSAYADIEGQALLKAFKEIDEVKALEYFKDSFVAREIKHKAMPVESVTTDVMTTQAEGTATYANLEMATLVKETGYQSEAAKGEKAISDVFRNIDDYIKKEGLSTLEDVSGRTLEVSQRPYSYGAFQCFLLDRFLPQWKKGFFEKNRTLDEVIAGLLKLSEEDKQRIAKRLKTDFAFDEIWAKHSRAIKERDDTVQLATKRKGKTYLIDLKQAQRGFEINPRNQEQVIMYKGDELFPHGLVKLIYGSLNMVSQDTPMRLSFYRNALEWVDTEAKEGEKGYELKYGEKVEDLYKDVSLTTKGFTMTAKAIKIVEEAGTVKISIID